jgi:hypothetical protein
MTSGKKWKPAGESMDTAKLESELRSFIRNAYPAMTVRVERVQTSAEHLAIYFIDASFRDLYPQQRYHKLTSLIPPAYIEDRLSGSEWFKLAPGESPETLRFPDDDLISSITPHVSLVLKNRGFFKVLDDTLCPISPDLEVVQCKGDFSNSKAALLACGFSGGDYDDVFGVLMAIGAYCDCEALYNVAGDNRVKAQYWKFRHTTLRQSDSQVS